MRLLFSTCIILISSSVIAQESAIDQRIKEEKALQESRFSIIPHKPNYMLPATYNSNIQSYDIYQDVLASDESLQPVEIKFQVSFKIPLLTGVVDSPFALYFGYTQVSFWQAYNSDNSSPFRETNYEPEFISTWMLNKPLGNDWNLKLASLNLTHQSNGMVEPTSRSWNRVESKFVFEKGDFSLVVNPWLRFNESASEDDNPDLLDYYGHGKIDALYKLNENTFSLISRNNFESGFSKGSVEFDWSFPINGNVRGYLQVFSGYGNSLIEYNEYTNTIGVGISLTDWL